MEQIHPNPQQPRVAFDAEKIRELAQSIEANGLIQPVVVEPDGEKYVLIDGERRLRAVRLLGWPTITAIVRENGSDADERLMQALVANLQRADLDPIEEAEAYQDLCKQGLNTLQISRMAGISYPRVRARLKLLDLDSEIKLLVQKGKMPIDPRVVDALLSIEDSETRIRLARRLARPGLKIKTVVSACKKLNRSLMITSSDEEETPGYEGALAIRQDVPALQMLTKDHRRKPPSAERWNALKQIGQVPPWEKLEAAVAAACDWCVLGSMATPEVCVDCPLVKALERLMESVEHD